MKKIPELLSPAGSMEHLKAAVQNGADAVYFGGEFLNARQSAANFTLEEIKEAVEYTKLRNVKTYITMNTLLKDIELKEGLQYAEKLYHLGVDAFILQDIGFAAAIKKAMPKMKLHYSTQGTTYDLSGCTVAKELGFERVVLARELSLNQISEISELGIVETEVFVHGAICMAYSGQCLMSSEIGGRSGNRGECAQPCRLPYRLIDREGNPMPAGTKYLLSPKDLSMLEHLGQLVDIGVSSIKIEGRLKSVEYTALTTGLYRKYLDDIKEEQESTISEKERKMDRKHLAQVFQRGGATQGYYFEKLNAGLLSGIRSKHWGTYIGKVEGYDEKRQWIEMTLEDQLSIGDGIEVVNDTLPGNVVTYIKTKHKAEKSVGRGEKVFIGDIKGKINKGDFVYKITDKELMRTIRETFSREVKRKILLQAKVEITLGSVVCVKVFDKQGNTGSGKGELPAEKAIKISLDDEKVKKQMEKTGNTLITLENIDICLEEGISVPMSEINKARRDAIDDFIKCKAASIQADIEKLPAGSTQGEAFFNQVYGGNKKPTGIKEKKVSLYFYRWNRENEELAMMADRCYIAYDQLIEIEEQDPLFLNRMKNGGVQIIAALPAITHGFHEENIKSFLSQNRWVMELYGISIGNLGQLLLLQEYEGNLLGDYSLNVWNQCSMQVLKDHGLSSATLSYEWLPGETRGLLEENMELEMMAFGKVPAMITEYCPIAGAAGIKKDHCNLCSEGELFQLKDRFGIQYPILPDKNSCKNIILNGVSRRESIESITESCADYYRICIYDEEKETIKAQIGKIREC